MICPQDSENALLLGGVVDMLFMLLRPIVVWWGAVIAVWQSDSQVVPFLHINLDAGVTVPALHLPEHKLVAGQYHHVLFIVTGGCASFTPLDWSDDYLCMCCTYPGTVFGAGIDMENRHVLFPFLPCVFRDSPLPSHHIHVCVCVCLLSDGESCHTFTGLCTISSMEHCLDP